MLLGTDISNIIQMCDWNNEGTSSTCMCSGDDWECYKPAQLQLLHLLSTAPGCVVVLTGDYHYSDIRVCISSGVMFS